MFRWLLLVVCFALAACGSSPGPAGAPAPNPGPTATSVSGVAATGAGIVGRVYLKDATGTERYVDTTDGTFTITTTGLTPPFLLKAVWTANGQVQTAYSFSVSGGNTNITPLTQIIVLNAAGVDSLDSLYGAPDGPTFAAIATALPVATAEVQGLLNPLLVQYGVANIDPLSAPITTNHQGMDGLLDNIVVSYANGTVTIADATSGAPLVQAPAHDITHALASADWTAADAAVASDPSVTVDPNGNALVAWWEMSGGHAVVRARFLNGNGATPTVLNPSGDAIAPRVVFDGSGNALAVWTQYENNRNDVWASRYVAGNAAWGTALRISDPNAVDSSYLPDVAVDFAGNAIVTWYQGDGRNNHFDAWSARYTAASDVWTTPQLVSDGVNSAYDVHVAINVGGNGLVAWEQEQGDGTTVSNGPRDIWARTVTSAGASGSSSKINAVAGNMQIVYGQVAVAVDSTGNGAVLWVQAAPSLFAINAANYVAGSGWQTSAVISSNLIDACYGPQLAFDPAGNAVAVWQQQTGSGAYTAANRFVAGGGWGVSASISDAPGDTFDPHVAVDPAGNATAIWWQFEGSSVGVRTARYLNGTGWSTSQILSMTPTDGYTTYPVPRVAAGSGGNTVAVWGTDSN